MEQTQMAPEAFCVLRKRLPRKRSGSSGHFTRWPQGVVVPYADPRVYGPAQPGIRSELMGFTTVYVHTVSPIT
jgi:hypothetical protein